jgi:hypothetical protein
MLHKPPPTLTERTEAHKELLKSIRQENATHAAFWIYQGAQPERNNWEALKLAYQKNSETCLSLCLKNCKETPPDQVLLSLLATQPETTDPRLIDRVTRLIKNPHMIAAFLQKSKEDPQSPTQKTRKFLQLQHELLTALQNPTNSVAL